jgi:L,D-transpeptidase YcbB
VRFNPSWNVPRSIAVKDKLPKLQSDPGYFVQKGYVLSDESGHEISPHSVNWSDITPSTFTYHLRQKPGAANALGKIRFNVVSPFSIYLHDTSDPQLFVKKVRTFSSGCIRVSEPVKLAYFVFNEPSRWTYETIAASMTGRNTQNVRPQKGVPIFITYFTVWAPDGEAARFMDDIYAQDAAILSAIKNRSSSN